MSHPADEPVTNAKIIMAVAVAALGYLVDAYDLIIFSIVRVSSLKSLGLSGDDLTTTGAMLLNTQMGGMLLGGLLWGIWGDKRGRLEVLFGSILLYSIANTANAFVTSVPQYALCRFFGGIGLAGEIGAGITLVSELMSKERRSYAVTIVAVAGLSGSVIASLVGGMFEWQTAYIAGGIMGFVLLALRVSLAESGMFNRMCQHTEISKGDLRLLFGSPARLGRYLACVFTALPLYLVTALVATFSPEIALSLGVMEPVSVASTILYASVSFTIGNLLTGLASQYFRTRKTVMAACNLVLLGGILILLNSQLTLAQTYYYAMIPIGLSMGMWSVWLAAIAENFGTNLRATVSTSAPNFVRGSTLITTTAFLAFKEEMGAAGAVQLITLVIGALSFVSLWNMRETYGIDLNFIETKIGTMPMTFPAPKTEKAGNPVPAYEAAD